MFPSGAKVEIERNNWGLDVHVYTPRADNPANEMGLCLDPKRQDVNTYGENLRYWQQYKHLISSSSSLRVKPKCNIYNFIFCRLHVKVPNPKLHWSCFTSLFGCRNFSLQSMIGPVGCSHPSPLPKLSTGSCQRWKNKQTNKQTQENKSKWLSDALTVN